MCNCTSGNFEIPGSPAQARAPRNDGEFGRSFARTQQDSIPFRCKWRRDEALVFGQRRNRSAIFVVRGNAERVEIGLLAFRPAFNPWAKVIRLS
jgi:hypothetical protein